MERIISEHGRFVATITLDPMSESPREWDNIGTMLYREHPHYCLGDELLPENWEDIVKDKVWLPYYALIHSGVRLSTTPFNDPWDSAIAGVIYADRKRAREFGFESDDKIRQVLAQEVQICSDYLSGQVYVTRIYRIPDDADPEAADLDECEEIDCVGGQYNYDTTVAEAQETLATLETEMPRQLSLLEEV